MKSSKGQVEISAHDHPFPVITPLSVIPSEQHAEMYQETF
jgi:hypothetical protein